MDSNRRNRAVKLKIALRYLLCRHFAFPLEIAVFSNELSQFSKLQMDGRVGHNIPYHALVKHSDISTMGKNQLVCIN